MRIITISREFGSGGRELGKRLADALNFPYYDKEIISAIAQKSNLDENYVENILQKGLTTNFPLTFRNTLYLQPNFLQEDELKVLGLSQLIIKELAQKGDCIMVGRGSNFILQEFNPLNLFIYADMEARIKRCQERAPTSENLTDQQMRKKIKQIDAGRIRYQKLFSSAKWGEKENYNLCINTSGLEVKSLVPSLKEYALCWFEEQQDINKANV